MENRDQDSVMSVEGLSLDFKLRKGIFHAVRDVSFQIRRGQTLCLVGESGSGKSVTARSLMQIVDSPGRIAQGRITLRADGREIDITALDPKGKEVRKLRGAKIGLIFQEPMSALSPFHTIGNQIDEVTLIHTDLDAKAARQRTLELLRQVEIANPEQMAERYAFEYSGGMRQRVCIAMALACNPDVLIADEPTTALDVTTQAEILDLVKRLQTERGMAMLLITHDMGIVAEVADEVAVMRYGRIVEHGSVDKIFHAPEHPYTRQLLDATLKLEQNARPATEAAEVAAPDLKPIISVRNLAKHYGGGRKLLGKDAPAIRAVDDVSLDLMPGENLGIVGESGSGKTTLGRLIMRIIDPTAGTILYRQKDGSEVDVAALDKAQLRAYHAEVRMIFQDPFASLNPRMTVKQIVGDPLYVNKLAGGRALEEKVAELLDMVGLEPSMMDRYPHAFSGGQRQRIGIARALALNPRVIIADEATSALDVSIRSQILDLLLDVQRRLGLSFIFISHDISVVRYFCDRVAVMHRGKVVEQGEAARICVAPEHPYSQALISAVPNPDPRNKRMLQRVRLNAS
ncbi:ABC transporter ATP-binding protein [Devosia elaeis]|uniref:ABC transporter ATP-binding protein n=1 Tax=Devosia elaeis TaxID=1770058 RepID=A0A178HSW0_9HYPH|nr:ABC transporter ATP-binding protein [Devosia elaeis]OAM75941.1 ABC transporter ATP-binding protein [Devosia elaeis]